MRRIATVVVASFLVVSIPGCSPSPLAEPAANDPSPAENSESSEEPIEPSRSIVVTTTILGSVVADIVACVGDPTIGVDVLMPIGADPHDFQPSSAQLAQMVESGTVVANGVSLELGLDQALEQVEADGALVYRVAEWIEPLPLGQHDHGHDDEAEGGEHGDEDPHFWFDMGRMAQVATRLGEELAPQFGVDFERCGADVASSISHTEQDVTRLLSEVPEEKRVLVTDHDAFGYFAERYGFRVLGVVIPGGSTLAEPSSEQLASLIAAIEAEGVDVIFGNVHLNSDLVAALAAETGGRIAVENLWVGSIGQEGTAASDYESMMLENARIISRALAG